MRRRDFISLKRAHEPTPLVRHDEIGECPSVRTTVSFGTHEVGNHEFSRARDHVRQIGFAASDELIGGFGSPLLVFKPHGKRGVNSPTSCGF